MKFKITSITASSNNMVLTIESTEDVKPKKEYNEVHKFIEQLKNSDKEIDKITASSLAGMVKYFESIQESEKREYKRREEISIDKTLFRELKINVDDIVNIEISKVDIPYSNEGKTPCPKCLKLGDTCNRDQEPGKNCSLWNEK